MKIILTFAENNCTIISVYNNGVSTLKHIFPKRVLCFFTAAVIVLLSGCGKKGNPDDNTIRQVNSSNDEVTVIERNFVGTDVSTPEYLGGVKLISENGNIGIKMKDFEHASVYCYTLDRDFFTIEKPLTAKDVIEKYKNELEKTFGVKFNVSPDFESEVYYSTVSTNSGSVSVAICSGDFDGDNGSAISVAIEPESGSGGNSGTSDRSTKTKEKIAEGDISGCWNSAYYLADNGNTIKYNKYSIFAYNTGSASLYSDQTRYEGTWKQKDKGYEFTFVNLHGYGEMAKINGGDYLIVEFDEVDGKIAFENLY